ncbi:Gmc oxidoreductase [Aspergillus sclerotialis]|uniref:Gmc oxidoreductase n=1 Tax=Aspergillus sclerotialis TaxID=2070753 RepID=A0A3A2ZJ24_9EURO|nr:Gmc oxidoreductase [Aspergillus sclerotialis]
MLPCAILASFAFQLLGWGALANASLLDHQFDYVVVGGGTAGNVMATRLAQSSFSVALIEAGGNYELESLAAVPAADVLPIGTDPSSKHAIDWGFVAQGQPGSNGRDLHYARGKCLGGSSALNFMIYQRPTRQTMDQWVALVNDSSYSFDETLPYYKKSVEFTPPDSDARAKNATAGYNSAAYDSGGGPLRVSYPNYAMPFSSWVAQGMESIGIHENQDFNLGSLMGAQYCATTINPADESRSSSESSFLGTNPSGLTMFAGTLAKRIHFNDKKKATGVEVKGSLGNTFTLSAKKEVILSAGAFQSPQLLMVSGIGPADTLKEHGVDVLVDLPGVGQNMWDHPFFGPSYRVKVTTFTEIAKDLLYVAGEVVNGLVLKNGPFTNPVGDFLAFEKIPTALRSMFTQQTQKALSWFSEDWPEAEYISAAGYIGNLSDPLSDQPKDGYQYASILGALVAPLSRGNITLSSADAEDPPILNPNWLGEKADEEVAIATFKRIREAFNTEGMKPVIIGEEYFPGKQVQSDTEILEFIKNNLTPIWHPACTCKMGSSDDPMAVLDNQARVFSVQNLRVVDASAFPLLPPGHPQATVYMLAEKISDAIIRDATEGGN